MLTSLQEQAVTLYREGKTMREVAAALGRSHEWVRKALKKAGEESRSRGREQGERPKCPVCLRECSKADAEFCSRTCLQMHRYKTASAKLFPALQVLRKGGTYAEAAEAAGFKSAWHLWGRMHHFGLTDQFKQQRPSEPAGLSDES